MPLQGPRTQIHTPTHRTSKLKPPQVKRVQNEGSISLLGEENQKISSNLDPQKYQLHLSDEDLSDEEDEDENNENEIHLFQEHVQEFHGDRHQYHHLQQPEKSYGKSIDSGPEKWPHQLISSVAALTAKREIVEYSNSKMRMEVGSNQASSKLKLKKAKGEVVEVHGGRIVRSTGRKDRHSKVCTARGPRDRRVRLSPNTAIQFYDVQDRLGYDRPSKAIDWLMKEAKSAIDALDGSSHSAKLNSTILMQSGDHLPENRFNQQQIHHESSKSVCEVQSQDYNGISNSNCSFFSMLNGVAPPSSTDQFNTYSQGNRSQAQGFCLSFQDLSFLFGSGQQGLLPASTPLHAESNQRIFTWNASGNAKGGESSLNNALPLHFPYQQQIPYQREPLQSSFSSSFQAPLNDQLPNLNYACLGHNNDGLLELSASARIQGDEEQNQISSKPSSATSLLHFQN